MSEATFSCPSCEKKFKRGNLPEGKKVKCPGCGEVFAIPPATIPTDEHLEEDRSPRGASRSSSIRSSSASSRASRGSKRNRSTSKTQKHRTKPEDQKKSIIPIAIGALVVLGIALFFLLKGGDKHALPNKGDQKTAQGGNQGTSPQKAPQTNEDLLKDLLARSTEGNTSDRIEALRQAIALVSQVALKSPPSLEDLNRKILALAPDDKNAHKALGEIQYLGDYKKYKGKWLSKEKYASVQKEWRKLREEEAKRKAEAAERLKWTKDAFAKKAAKTRDYFKKDVAKVPGLKLRFFFDTPQVPKPYFLMVEDRTSPDPTQTAEILGPGLAALRKAFAQGYPKGTFPNWDDTEFVVPVMVFANEKSYENYRKNGHGFFPGTGLAAAFYTSRSEIPEAFRGVLYVWQGAKESQFFHEVFHEATHQLMHNACQGEQMGPTPWLEEGIAEYWGTYRGNKYKGFTFGHFLEGRFPTIQNAAKSYYQALKAGKKTGAFLTPKQMLNIDQQKFVAMKAILDGRVKGTPQQKMEAGLTVSLIYAQGWAFIYFCYNFKDGKYKKAFEKIVHDELRYQYSFDHCAKYLGMKSDEDWARLNKEYFLFCFRTMRRLANR